MIRLLGQAEYGLYAMIGSLVAYFSILDMGLGNTIVRYTSRNRAIGNKKVESNLNGMFLILYSIIGLITFIVGFIIYKNVDNIFASNLTLEELRKAKIMVIVLTINFALSFPLSVFGAIMQAYERFVIVKLVAIIKSLAVPIITLPFLIFGFGSVTMVIIFTILNISCLLFNVMYCFNKLNVRFYFENMEFGLLKEILGYSFFIFLNVIVDQIYWNTDQIILGIVAGTIPVAIFAIAMQFINLYKNFSNALASLFLPRISIMEAKKASSDEFTNIMIKFGRVQYLIMALILTGFILFGYPFIKIWAGENYVIAYYIVLIIMIPLTIPLIQNIGISILQAKNLHGFRSTLYLIIAIVNIIITIPLAKYYGGIGAAISTAISMMVGHIIIMNFYYHIRIGINMVLFWKNILTISIPVVFSLLIGFGINYLIQENSIFTLTSKIILYTLIYSVLIWKYGMNSYEKQLVSSIRNRAINTLAKNN